jgi:hypothetical protein
VEAAHRPVKLRPGDVGSVLGLDQPFPGLLGLCYQLLVHIV